MLVCQVLLAFWTALVAACHRLSSLRKMSLLGPTSVNIILEFTTLLASLHLPQGKR